MKIAIHGEWIPRILSGNDGKKKDFEHTHLRVALRELNRTARKRMNPT
ncbi:MAG: hypothetical protein ACR2P7_10265 [bacterium]